MVTAWKLRALIIGIGTGIDAAESLGLVDGWLLLKLTIAVGAAFWMGYFVRILQEILKDGKS